MNSSFAEIRSIIILTCALVFFLNAKAQEVNVIDNKGTIHTVRNNQVTTSNTAPLTPLMNDVWFDTTNTTNVIAKTWNGNGWIIVGGVSTDVNNALTAGTDSGAYKALRIMDVYDDVGGQRVNNQLVKLNLSIERTNVGFASITSDEVVIPEDGYYKVAYHATFRTEAGDGTRTTARVELQIDGNREPGTDSYSYHRQNNTANNSSGNVSTSTAGRSLIKFFSEGEALSLHAVRFEGPNNRQFETLAEGTGITVHKLN
ncbi:hypothetical protein [Urechidicola vernalis]|uniref:Uncharacterized protein n=1 Tax=Urechidicola vernalis TaxID=3075600 RepID=A0ABU2Y7U1_9FLAO|nr:hypothetical protein [Urechidicola sp. P050]MDT0554273.1 hypothetical protein [Urechidicola sp. P050]